VITTRALTKRYGAVSAVQSVDLDVREGDRYGLLGPNGSGKTTLVHLLLGLVFATSGEIEVMGQRIPRHVRDVLPQVGALIEEPAAYPHLSGRVNLSLLDAAGPGGRAARRSRCKRIDEALEQVGLAGVGRRPVKAYSLGMRQRLGLAAALIRRPRLLILDEPGNGLDPRGIRDLRELIIGLNETGVTVLLSSHLLAEVEQLCTRVGVLDGHTLSVMVETARPCDPAAAAEAMRAFRGDCDGLDLPSAPAHPILVHDDPFRPQPRLDRDAEGGMATSVGRLRAEPALRNGLKYVALSHNTRMGAAQGAVLTAEHLCHAGVL